MFLHPLTDWEREQIKYRLVDVSIALEDKFDLPGGALDNLDYYIDVLLSEIP